MDALRKAGDSCGARITVTAQGVPPGLGEPLFDKLDAEIAYAMMGINAVKGVEIGSGFGVVTQKGSEHGDELSPEGFRSNHAGGVLGGISTGQDLVVSIAVKPTSSIRLPRASIDRSGAATTVETHGRHDPCVGIRATPIAEAMLALVVMDHALRHRAQCGDVSVPVPPDRRRAAARRAAASMTPCVLAAPVRTGVVLLFRRHGRVLAVRAAVVSRPRSERAGDRLDRVAAVVDARVRAVQLGLAGRPQRPPRRPDARWPACCAWCSRWRWRCRAVGA